MNSLELSSRVAYKIKLLRSQRGWSLDTTAKRTGVSKAMLGQIERGESNPTIGTLWKIASGFGCSFSSFFVGKNEPLREQAAFADDPDMHITTVFPYSSEARMEMFEITLQNYHKQESDAHQTGVVEHVVVKEGVLELLYDGEWHSLHTGDCARFCADQQHGYMATQGKVVFQNIITYP